MICCRSLFTLLLALLPIVGLTACGSSGGGGGGGTPPSGLAYSATSFTLTRGVEISPLAATVTGTVTSFSIASGTLPTGLVLDPATGTISGIATQVQAATVVTIAATNGDGSDTEALTFTVAAPAARALYAINNNEDVIGLFSIDPATGRLNARGDVTGPDSPAALGISNDFAYLYVPNSVSGTISGFAIDPGTADLTELAGSPFTMTGTTTLVPNRVAMQPSGSTMYVANRTSGNISLFDIGAGGALTEKAGSPFGTLTGARDVRTVHLASGDFLYVTAPGLASGVVAHAIAADGTLTQIDADTTGNTPTYITATPDGEFLYLVNENDSTVSGYAIDANDGTLTELSGSPYAIAGASGVPTEIELVDDGTTRNVYVPSINGVVSMFAVAGDGNLSLLSPATVAGAGGLMTGIAATPDGSNVYLCDTTAREILTFSVGFGGALAEHLELPIIRSQGRMRNAIVLPSLTTPTWNTSQVYGTNFSANAINGFDVDAGKMMTAQVPATTGVSLQPEEVAISKDGTMLYVTHPGDVTAPLLSVPINPDGTLDNTSATALAGNNASFVEIDPAGDFLYVVDATGQTLRPYPLGGTGLIGPAQPSLPTGNAPLDLAIDPTGRFAYVTNFASNTISQYSINLTTGQLTAMTPPTVGTPPGVRGITIHPSGRFAYATAVDTPGPNTDLIVTYLVDRTTGALTAMTPAFTAANVDPGSVVCTPNGKWLLVANTHSSSSNITSHLINDFAVSGIQDGQLNAASGTAPTTTQPQVIAVTQDGTEIYVGINVGTGIEAFSIDGTGAFTSLDAEATGGVIHDIVLRETRD